MLHGEEHDRTTCIQSELILNVTKNPLILHADNILFFLQNESNHLFIGSIHVHVNMNI